MKVESLDRVPCMRMLIYGDSGSGKTTLMGTAMECEETFPLLVLDARGQSISLRRFDPQPLVLTIEDMKDFNVIYEFFRDGQDMEWLAHQSGTLASLVAHYLESVGADKFGSVGIDSITHVQRIAMGGIVGTTPLPGDIPPQTKIQQWGRTLAQVTNFTDLFFQLPIPVIMTALARRDNIEALGLVMFAPFLWGQSQLEVPSHAEIVGRLMCTSTVPVKEQRMVEQAAAQASRDIPFNILYLQGGRDYIAKWQGVIDPPLRMAVPTVDDMMKVICSQ